MAILILQPFFQFIPKKAKLPAGQQFYMYFRHFYGSAPNRLL